MKKIIRNLALVLIAAAVMSLCACGSNTNNDTTAQAETTQAAAQAAEDVTVKGEGQTSFYFNVVDADGNETYFEIKTDKTTVGEALLDLGLIDGEDSEYGLYVKSVNGIEADYDKDKVYWAFYIDGEYAETGVDSTDITAGSTYEFKIEK